MAAKERIDRKSPDPNPKRMSAELSSGGSAERRWLALIPNPRAE